MPDSLTIDFADPIPLFPLPQCVLLPHVTIPLHIFEPRYRQMIADVLEASGLIAMASYEGEGWKNAEAVKPPIRPFVCLGYIIRHQSLEDGRSNIYLQGVCRARIKREVKHTPYRMAYLEPTEPEPVMDIDLTDQRTDIEMLLTDPLLSRLAAVCAIQQWLSPEVPTVAVIDLMIMNLTIDFEQRYALLAEPDAATRARWLQRFLIETRRTIEVARGFDPKAEGLEITLN